MDWLIQYALQFVGKAYHWGGDDPIGGFDCSGFVQEILFAAGEMPFGTPKMSAQGIYDHYYGSAAATYNGGSLAFFGQDAKHVSHIGFCISNRLMLEAGGGDSTTLTESVAMRRNAFIKLRPIKYRKDFFCVLKPQYINLGMI